MAISTSEVLYLGNFADADGTGSSVNPNVYLGTFGSPADPLAPTETVVTYDDVNSNGVMGLDNQGYEPITYDLGGGPVTAEVDSVKVVSLTVTYMDGTSQSYSNAVMYQDTTGNLFLTNSNFAGTDLNSGTGTSIQSINVTSVSPQNYTGLFQNALQDFVCFAAGTAIRTPDGDRPVETLTAGDLVMTMDDGPQPIQWIGINRVAVNERLTPVRIRAGALGEGLPSHDLIVSRQHRMLIRSKIVQRMFNTSEVLVAAKSLLDLEGVELVQGCHHVTYCHILFGKHHVIFANDAPSESLLPGPQAMEMMGDDARAEVLEIFPNWLDDTHHPEAARMIPRGRQQKTLSRRHQKNHLPAVGHLIERAA